jgi:hypothetical protein
LPAYGLSVDKFAQYPTSSAKCNLSCLRLDIALENCENISAQRTEEERIEALVSYLKANDIQYTLSLGAALQVKYRSRPSLTLLNVLAARLDAPDYAYTSQRQVRLVRMKKASSLGGPKFMGIERVDESVGSAMSPLQAAAVITSLITFKLVLPEFQVPPAEWDETSYERMVRELQLQEEAMRRLAEERRKREELEKQGVTFHKRAYLTLGPSRRTKYFALRDILHLPPGPYDLVYSFGVLHHTPNPLLALPNACVWPAGLCSWGRQLAHIVGFAFPPVTATLKTMQRFFWMSRHWSDGNSGYLHPISIRKL